VGAESAGALAILLLGWLVAGVGGGGGPPPAPQKGDLAQPLLRRLLSMSGLSPTLSAVGEGIKPCA